MGRYIKPCSLGRVRNSTWGTGMFRKPHAHWITFSGNKKGGKLFLKNGNLKGDNKNNNVQI
jgi:hypothetical protein